MKNLERAKLDSYNRITKFNTTHGSVLGTIPDYAGVESNFNTLLGILTSAANVQALDTKGNTNASETAKQTMAKLVIKFAKRGAVKARLLSNLELAGELDEPISYILRATKTDAVKRASDMRNALNNNLSTLTTITAANISQIDNAITAYNGIKDNPTIAIQVKKASGTDVLPGNYALIDAAVDNMFDLIYSYYEDTNAALVDEFALAKQLLNTGIRHTSVEITVTDVLSGKAINACTVTDVKSGKIYGGDEGVVDIPKHRSGHYHFTVSAEDYANVDLGVDIKHGMSNEFTVKMKRVIGPITPVAS